MKPILIALVAIAMVSCKKGERHVRYSVCCDDCSVAYHGRSADLNTGRYISPGRKEFATLSEVISIPHGTTASITLHRDSGYAFMSIRSGIETVQRRVMSEQETIELR